MSAPSSPNANPKYTWHDAPRAGWRKRSAAERLADFLEIHGPLDEATAREQAERCIQCPDPLCVAGCPLGNRIGEWLALTAEGRFSEAASLLQCTGCLPEITARICPSDHLCEARCVLEGRAAPVAIQAIEQFLSEYALRHGGAEASCAPANGLRVAVVGAGPGGLACADALSRLGYAVTVFDSRPVAGGLLVSGTPAFRVDESVVAHRVALLRNRGVEFRLAVRLGEDVTCAELRARFHAVYLGLGARKPRELEVPGRGLRGVHQALELLLAAHGGAAPGDPHADVAGKRVVVLGGGDMAVDCVRTALRDGANEVVGAYRRGSSDMSCAREEYENAVEEGARFLFCVTPQAVLDNGRGEVSGVRFLRTELGEPDADGRRPFRILPGTEQDVPADRVFLALGFERAAFPQDDLLENLARDDQGGIAVDENQMASLPGFFAGGDWVRGPTNVLTLLCDARRAAEGIHAHLSPRREAGAPPPAGCNL